MCQSLSETVMLESFRPLFSMKGRSIWCGIFRQPQSKNENRLKIKLLLVTTLVLILTTVFTGTLAGCGKQEGLLPVFSIGDKWVSKWNTEGEEYLVTSEITGEAAIEGKNCWTMTTTFDPPYMGQVTSMINNYDKATMNIIKMDLLSTTPGDFTTAVYQTTGDLLYPVAVGKNCREVEFQTLTWGDASISQSQNSTTTTVTKVDKIEKITVAAGTFNCFKMLKYDADGNLTQISWRSVDTKMFQVKMEDMAEPDAVYELVSYSVK